MAWFTRILAVWLLYPCLSMAEGKLILLTVDDAIGPATSDYVKRGLEQAVQRQALLTVIKLDTPGGLDTSMRDIVRDIIASPVPVIVYVAPSGARAASAGTYILYAAHLAAMAPGTNVGAATPVQLGGLPDFDTPPEEDKGKSGEKQEGAKDKTPAPKDAMTRKVVNDAVAYIRSLAEMRARNAEWAELAVREAASLSAEEALKKGVIEVVAADLYTLLGKINGRKVNVLGAEKQLQTQGASVDSIEPDWRNRLLAVITNPNIAYILMLLGIYGLFFELANPGFILPGVIGGICLLLALYALQVLPVNYAGLALMLLGIAFMISEVFVPSFGVLGIGGVIAFVIGSVILFETDVEGYSVSIPLIGGIALVGAGIFMGIIAMALRIHRRPAVTGLEEMIGGGAEVQEDFQGVGRVRAHGENWHAISRTELKRGQRVRITGMDGLKLIVEPETKEQ